jgi:hypothetical protein
VQGSRIDCRENKARIQSETETQKEEESLLTSRGEGRRGSALGREAKEGEIGNKQNVLRCLSFGSSITIKKTK